MAISTGGMGSVAAIVSVLVKTILDKESIAATNQQIVSETEAAGAAAGGNFKKGVLGNIKGLAKNIAGVFAVTEGIKFAKESINTYKDTAAEIRKLQRVTGGTAEDLSKINYAAKEAGIGTEKLGMAFKFLSRNTAAANDQNAKFEKDRSAAAIESKKYEDDAWKALYKHKNVTQEMIDKTKANIAEHQGFNKELGKQAKIFADLGIRLKDNQGNNRQLNDLLIEISDRFSKLPNGVDKSAMAMKLFGRQGLDLLPFLNKGSAALEEYFKQAEKSGAVMSQVDLDKTKKAQEEMNKFHEALDGIKITLGRDLFPVIEKLMKLFREQLIPVIEDVIKFTEQHSKEIGIVVMTILPLIGIVKTINGLFNAWIAVTKAMTIAQAALNIMLDANPIGLIVIGIAALILYLGYAYTHFKGFRDAVKEWGRDIVEMFEWAINGIKKFINYIREKLEPVINTIKKVGSVLKFAFDPSKENYNAIFGRAMGGQVQAGTTYLIGEKGPELFVPQVSGSVIPNNKINTNAGDNYNIVINNPLNEPSSNSIPNALRRATYLKGVSV